eukprot:g23862.t1
MANMTAKIIVICQWKFHLYRVGVSSKPDQAYNVTASDSLSAKAISHLALIPPRCATSFAEGLVHKKRSTACSSNKLDIFVTSKKDQAKISNCAYRGSNSVN